MSHAQCAQCTLLAPHRSPRCSSQPHHTSPFIETCRLQPPFVLINFTHHRSLFTGWLLCSACNLFSAIDLSSSSMTFLHVKACFGEQHKRAGYDCTFWKALENAGFNGPKNKLGRFRPTNDSKNTGIRFNIPATAKPQVNLILKNIEDSSLDRCGSGSVHPFHSIAFHKMPHGVIEPSAFEVIMYHRESSPAVENHPPPCTPQQHGDYIDAKPSHTTTLPDAPFETPEQHKPSSRIQALTFSPMKKRRPRPLPPRKRARTAVASDAQQGIDGEGGSAL